MGERSRRLPSGRGLAAAYEGLMERYPGAKVILTVRHSERRYKSTRKTIYEVQRATESRSYAWWPC